MERTASLAVCLAALLGPSAPGAQRDAQRGAPRDGPWRAWLVSPGGELPFGLELALADGRREAALVNGSERIPIPRVTWDGEVLELAIDHYAARLVARLGEDGALEGAWTKRRAGGEEARLALRAEPGAGPRFRPLETSLPRADVSGRWAASFEQDELPAVAELRQAPDGTLAGTFLTATGDWRWLAGDVSGDTLRLSAFDGAHAFLLVARLDEQGELRGDFYSGDSWHETWHARRDEHAEPPDAFAQTRWDESVSLADIVVPDLEGAPRSLAQPAFGARAVVLQLFGSWCPNCHDEGAYLAELERRYRSRGLVVLGLAFELDDDRGTNAEQVRRYARRHGCEYPFFLAGSAASKAVASQAFPAIDRLRAYPTTVFLHGDGRVRAVHSGFAGPATGAEHEALAREFEALVEELVSEPEPDDGPLWTALETCEWRAAGAEAPRYRFERAASRAVRTATDGSALELPVRARGDLLLLDGELWRWDRAAGALLDPRERVRRLVCHAG